MNESREIKVGKFTDKIRCFLFGHKLSKINEYIIDPPTVKNAMIMVKKLEYVCLVCGSICNVSYEGKVPTWNT